MNKYIVTQTQHEQLLEILSDACDLATAEADYVHEAYRGYKPEKHKYVDDQVKQFKDTYDAVNALKQIEPITDSLITSLAYDWNALSEVVTDRTLAMLCRAIEAHITGGDE